MKRNMYWLLEFGATRREKGVWRKVSRCHEAIDIEVTNCCKREYFLSTHTCMADHILGVITRPWGSINQLDQFILDNL